VGKRLQVRSKGNCSILEFQIKFFLEKISMKRKITHIFANVIFRLFSRVSVSGIHNLPTKGPAILAVNHLSIIDAPLVFAVVPRDDLTALVAKNHRKSLFLRLIVNAVNGIWINREDADTQAVRASRDHLKAGGMLGIAPEGTRSHSGELAPAKTGVAYLANLAQVPIIPVAITGTYKGIKKVLLLRRPRFHLTFGKPFVLPPIDRKNRDKALQLYTDEIMCRIAALLPPEHRGIYGDHPRTLEFLEKLNDQVL
jgi:1-acyl-sn-glycerol-3-phosphate acyltransferase